MRVLFISLVSVIVLFVVLTITRLWGLGQQYPEFEHSFFDGAPVTILRVQTENELTEALQQKPDMIFWMDVTTTADQKLIVFSRDFSNKEMSIEAYRGPKSQAYSFQQLHNMHPEIRELTDVFGKYSQQKFILNVADNVENIDKNLVEALKDLSADKRVLIQSNYNVVINSIKELKPFWLYGSSQADLMRLLTFESMWILSATPFKGDVLIAPFVLLGRPAFHEVTIEEMRRRHKKIVLGPALDKKEFDDAARLKADGVIVENLSDFLEWSRP